MNRFWNTLRIAALKRIVEDSTTTEGLLVDLRREWPDLPARRLWPTISRHCGTLCSRPHVLALRYLVETSTFVVGEADGVRYVTLDGLKEYYQLPEPARSVMARHLGRPFDRRAQRRYAAVFRGIGVETWQTSDGRWCWPAEPIECWLGYARMRRSVVPACGVTRVPEADLAEPQPSLPSLGTVPAVPKVALAELDPALVAQFERLGFSRQEVLDRLLKTAGVTGARRT